MGKSHHASPRRYNKTTWPRHSKQAALQTWLLYVATCRECRKGNGRPAGRTPVQTLWPETNTWTTTELTLAVLRHRQNPARVASIRRLPPVGAHTDAQGWGRIAAVFGHRSHIATAIHLPWWFFDLAFQSDGESSIYLSELSAAALMAFIALERGNTMHQTCALRIDNQAAGSALVKGRSPSPMGNMLVSLFWTTAARGHIPRGIGYVNAKSNCADPLSRRWGAPQWGSCATIEGPPPGELHQGFCLLGSSSSGRGRLLTRARLGIRTISH